MVTSTIDHAIRRVQGHGRTKFDSNIAVRFLQVIGLTLLSCLAAFADEPVAWNFDRGDCEMVVVEQTLQPATNSKPAAIRARLRAKVGSHAYAMFESPEQMPVIAELKVSLEIKASCPGLQLFVRAVLPRSVTEDGPRTLLIAGPTYSAQGQWQTLSMGGLPQLLEKHVRLLRVASPEPIDSREAFIDMVGVNVYGGTGMSTVWLAAPTLDGAALYRSSTELALSSVDRLPTMENHEVRCVGSLITIDGRPLAIRAIRPRGESWQFLKQLGFNTLWLHTIPSAEQMAKAEQLGLWLVARVPSLQNLSLLDSHLYRRVVAWDLQNGDGTLAEQQALAESIRYSCGSAVKPLLCANLPHPSWGSRFADIVVHNGSALGTTETSRVTATLLAQEVDSSLPTAVHWSTIRTHLPGRTVQQARLLARNQTMDEAAFQPAQISLAASNSIAAGVRVFCVDDELRLDGADLQSQIRTATLRRFNRMHSAFSPWLLGDRVPLMQDGDLPHLDFATMETNRSLLAIPVYRPPHQQLCAAAPPSHSMTVTLQHPSEAAGVYLIRDDGLHNIPNRRIAGGTQFVIEDLSSLWAVLVTADDRIAGRISAKLRQSMSNGTGEQELAKLMRKSGKPSGTKDDSCLYFQNARKLWDAERHDLPPATCPLLAHANWSDAFATWQAGSPAVARGVNLLVGSDFEDLNRLLSSGWSAEQLDEPGMTAQISLSDQGRTGRCLRIAVDQPGSTTVRSRRPLACVSSAPLDIAKGQPVRIEGWIRVRSAPMQQQPVATVFDSWAGPSIAWHQSTTSGWQPFTLYRVCTGEPLVITCGLTAPGELLVDDLQISPMADATIVRR